LRTGIEIKEANKEEMQQILRWFNMDPVEHTTAKDINATGFVAKKGGRIIGYLDLVRRPEQYYPFDGYWLHSLIVKTHYRRMGIGEELMLIAMKKGREEGAKGLSLLLYEDNYRTIKLHRKLGFEMRVIPALEKKLEEERRTTGRRQVVMFADLS
jgi:ribosomal protein S18 acetylase RimI-like enzyme